MCECYVIGGPFIGADPDCPEHGTNGYLSQIEEHLGRIAHLERANERLEDENRRLRDRLAELEE